MINNGIRRKMILIEDYPFGNQDCLEGIIFIIILAF